MSNENGSKKPKDRIRSNEAIQANTLKVFNELLELIKNTDITENTNLSENTDLSEDTNLFDDYTQGLIGIGFFKLGNSGSQALLKMIIEKHSSINDEKEKTLLGNAQMQLAYYINNPGCTVS